MVSNKAEICLIHFQANCWVSKWHLQTDSSSEFARQEFDRPMTWPIGDIVENKKGVSKWKLIKKMKIKSKQKTKLKNNNQTI